jgi:tRNA(fMet)-specific endonuclease VapC
MRRYLLDTGIVGDLLNDRNGVLDRYRLETAKGNRVGTGVPVVAEILFGIEYGQNRDRNMQSFHRVLPLLRIWPFDLDAAYVYGQIAAQLERTGRPMQIPDMMIAAIALTLGNCTVVTKDSDLSAITGLDVVDWTA